MFLRPFARTPLVIVERNSNLGTVTVKDWTARKLSKFGLATFSESYFKTRVRRSNVQSTMQSTCLFWSTEDYLETFIFLIPRP